MEFIHLKQAVAKQYAIMSKYELFRTEADGNELCELYLNSFPKGSNEIFRERAVHDCNCCKSFIRTLGNVVAIVDGKLISIWDVIVDKEPDYQVVVDALSKFVKSKKVVNIFLHYEKTAGVDQTLDDKLNAESVTWNHFFVNIPNGKNGDKKFVCSMDKIATKLGEARSEYDVFYRGLKELTMSAVDIVSELISQNSINRGVQYKHDVEVFKTLKIEFDKLSKKKQEYFAWEKVRTIGGSVAKIRNTAIGSLLIDLSKDVELNKAVKSFEDKVSGTNYQRTTALITPSMTEEAKKIAEEHGLISALDRRYATLNDISINDILFADRNIKKNLSGNVFDELANSIPKKKKNISKVEEVNIEKFIEDILPKADSIELFVENRHAKNLVSLVAPVDPTANQLFKWNNKFSWSFNGDVADSVKEKVKRAGGNVTGDFCNRLSWDNTDDLDIHMKEPDGHEIYYSNRGRKSSCGGMLDVDMNVCPETRQPVENIVYENKSDMKEGKYTLIVHQYNKRENIDVGFQVELEVEGIIYNFTYDKAVTGNVVVAEIEYSKSTGFKVNSKLPCTQKSKEIWNIKTESFETVSVVMMSPNYWNEKAIGNKHYFFMLDNCINKEQTRGFYNEFLREELSKCRKVFEVLGSKMKTPLSDNQLSGIGFSATKRDNVLCRVNGSFTRTVKILF